MLTPPSARAQLMRSGLLPILANSADGTGGSDGSRELSTLTVNASGTDTPEAPRPGSPRRRWLLRCLAVGLGLLPFVVLEGVLHVAGLGCRAAAEDPFVTLDSVEPLFVLSPDGERYEIPTSRHVFFRYDSFPARKPPGAYRIFCLGGSTVQGRPYSTETAFATWLELALGAADPSVDWRVVNCGGISYASYRLVPILAEILDYEPDLIVICTGHNEFLEERTYGHLGRRADRGWTPISLLGQLHCYRLGRGIRRRRVAGRQEAPPVRAPTLPGEVDALLDHKWGHDRYSRDDERSKCVIEHFESSLTRMLRLARQRDVPVLLLAPPSNLKDCPPFKSEPASGLTSGQREQFAQLCAAADAVPWSDVHGKIPLLEQAVAIDPRHAGAQFRLGTCYEVAGLLDKALSAFTKAKDEDVCPLRMLESMRAGMSRAAEVTGTAFIDVHARFAATSAAGLLGNELLLDHVHPTVEGHQQIALMIAEHMVEAGIIQPREGWQVRREAAFAQQIASLNPTYFFHGRERLERVQRWARGRTD